MALIEFYETWQPVTATTAEDRAVDAEHKPDTPHPRVLDLMVVLARYDRLFPAPVRPSRIARIRSRSGRQRAENYEDTPAQVARSAANTAAFWPAQTAVLARDDS